MSKKESNKKTVTFHIPWKERVKKYDDKARLYMELGEDGLIREMRNMQKAIAQLIPIEEELFKRRRISKEPNTINISQADYEKLLFWVYRIEQGAAYIHYLSRLQNLTNIPISGMLKKALELDRLRDEVFKEKQAKLAKEERQKKKEENAKNKKEGK